MRRLLTAALGLGLLALAGCSGDADPAPAPASPSSTTASPSPSPSPTAPVMPEAARAHTEAGAKAFVEYFWEVVNYAQATGDTKAVAALSDPSCAACRSGIAAIRKVYDAGGRTEGGLASISRMQSELLSRGEPYLVQVTYRIQVGEQRNDLPGTDQDTVEPGYRARDRAELLASDSSWSLIKLEALE